MTDEFPTRRSLRDNANTGGEPDSPSEGDTVAGQLNPSLENADLEGKARHGGDLLESVEQRDDAPTDEGVSVAIAEPARARSRRSRRRVWIVLITIVAILGAGTAIAWGPISSLVAALNGPEDYEGSGQGSVEFAVAEGDTGESIARNLVTAGVTKSFDAFYELCLRENPVFEPGVFALKRNMSARAALDALLDSTNRLENTVLITEGQTEQDVFAELESVLGISRDELESLAAEPSRFGLPAEASSLEGFLFPATYQFNPGTTAHEALKTMIERSFEALDAAGVAPADRWNTVVLASLIQKEAGLRDDFYKVSRVFLNRLNPDLWPLGLLQSDATVAYGTGNTHRVSTTDAERADASNPFNTYVHPGLVRGPISNPGELAIDAALHPADGPWLYFVTVNLETGETVFSTTAAEHEAAVEQWLAWMAEHPEYQ
ncbi:MAG TPA: endolytic transglycosylase MltG [Microbacteriaceae bacterium]|nr:endolytic transglycosylase MltG [Microbacteriaceae bacterium]